MLTPQQLARLSELETMGETFLRGLSQFRSQLETQTTEQKVKKVKKVKNQLQVPHLQKLIDRQRQRTSKSNYS